ncbi:hypothetical protein M405DRAFT_245119 [Rhizopogon salebrosus TDB-379]|nr:hypothetical protein M405DRAFT_245119 [Rhizopogon salebrosus TDB-379]
MALPMVVLLFFCTQSAGPAVGGPVHCPLASESSYPPKFHSWLPRGQDEQGTRSATQPPVPVSACLQVAVHAGIVPGATMDQNGSFEKITLRFTSLYALKRRSSDIETWDDKDSITYPLVRFLTGVVRNRFGKCLLTKANVVRKLRRLLKCCESLILYINAMVGLKQNAMLCKA